MVSVALFFLSKNVLLLTLVSSFGNSGYSQILSFTCSGNTHFEFRHEFAVELDYREADAYDLLKIPE